MTGLATEVRLFWKANDDDLWRRVKRKQFVRERLVRDERNC